MTSDASAFSIDCSLHLDCPVTYSSWGNPGFISAAAAAIFHEEVLDPLPSPPSQTYLSSPVLFVLWTKFNYRPIPLWFLGWPTGLWAPWKHLLSASPELFQGLREYFIYNWIRISLDALTGKVASPTHDSSQVCKLQSFLDTTFKCTVQPNQVYSHCVTITNIYHQSAFYLAEQKLYTH